MPSRDHHTALRSDVVERVSAGRVAAVLVKLQSGKNDVAITLHVNPTSFTTAGVQTREWLQMLEFTENAGCGFSGGLHCFSREVSEGYDLRNFATAFNDGFTRLDKATGDFEACNFDSAEPFGEEIVLVCSARASSAAWPERRYRPSSRRGR